MIPSVPNPPMTKDEIIHFRNELERRVRGEFTQSEINDIRHENEKRERIYNQIMANCGGKNPIFGS